MSSALQRVLRYRGLDGFVRRLSRNRWVLTTAREASVPSQLPQQEGKLRGGTGAGGALLSVRPAQSHHLHAIRFPLLPRITVVESAHRAGSFPVAFLKHFHSDFHLLCAHTARETGQDLERQRTCVRHVLKQQVHSGRARPETVTASHLQHGSGQARRTCVLRPHCAAVGRDTTLTSAS